MAISQINSNGFGPTSWTTAGRPASPFVGQTGVNTTLGLMEYWSGNQWVNYGTLSATSVSYLVVAGGGGGAKSGNSTGSGAGGAGGMLTSTLSVTPGTSYTVTVGAGGAASTGAGNNGSNSAFGSITSVGGGGGGQNATAGATGGSGGGAGAVGEVAEAFYLWSPHFNGFQAGAAKTSKSPQSFELQAFKITNKHKAE